MSDSTPAHGARTPLRAGSRRRVVIIAVAVAVAILAGVGAAIGGVFGGGDPVAAPSPSTVTLASPTPTIEPVARQPLTPFADALPATVLSYALAAVAGYEPLVAAGALEGHQLDYSGGGAESVTLYAGQFETAEAASAAYATLVGAPAPAPETGVVEVAGQPAGAWTVTEAADGTGAVTWTNGTALFQALGPADVVKDFYEAFPL